MSRKGRICFLKNRSCVGLHILPITTLRWAFSSEEFSRILPDCSELCVSIFSTSGSLTFWQAVYFNLFSRFLGSTLLLLCQVSLLSLCILLFCWTVTHALASPSTHNIFDMLGTTYFVMSCFTFKGYTMNSSDGFRSQTVTENSCLSWPFNMYHLFLCIVVSFLPWTATIDIFSSFF